MPAEDVRGRFNPGAIRESDIHQDDVRFEPLDRLYCGCLGSCLADNGNALAIVQDRSQADTDHFVIVD